MKKNGVHWNTHFSYNLKTTAEFTMFYLLPTIEFFRDTTLDEDGDCSFDIRFEWLFWSFTITRYWGSAYENR